MGRTSRFDSDPRTAGIGATSPLRRVPAKDRSPARADVQPCAIGGRINSTGSAEGLSEFVVPAQERVKESYGHSFSRHPGESRGPSRGSTNLAGSLTHCHCLKTSEWR